MMGVLGLWLARRFSEHFVLAFRWKFTFFYKDCVEDVTKGVTYRRLLPWYAICMDFIGVYLGISLLVGHRMPEERVATTIATHSRTCTLSPLYSWHIESVLIPRLYFYY